MSWPDRKLVLVPIDLADPCFEALDEAITMVESPSDVRVIYVLPSLETEAEFVRAAFDSTSREADAKAAMEAKIGRARNGVQVIIRTGSAGNMITATAEELGCDLVVIAPHGRSAVAKFFLGSVTERVIRHAACSVLVFRDR